MSKKSVRPATRPQSSPRQAAADCINRALEKSDIAESVTPLARPPGFTIFLTLLRNLGLRGRAFIVRLQAIQ